MYLIDIDTGGTMTDALVYDGKNVYSFKTDTTPHDLTVSFWECLLDAARHFGIACLSDFLAETRLIRWSSTITSNVLAELRGSKIGLLLSAGHERDLYGSGESPAIGKIIDAESIIGLKPEPDAPIVLAAVKRLLEDGVRRVCVSLDHAYPQNDAEHRIKAMIEQQYPDHCLGAVPVLLGSEMLQLPDDRSRTHFALINGYIHTPLASSLFKAEDLLNDDKSWRGTLLIGHTNGGVARIGKTKAVDTVESGPVFGTFGGAYFARQYNFDAALCLDVGGTTSKASVVMGGEPVFLRGGDLIGIPVLRRMALLRSAIIGGGTVARVVDQRSIKLGPTSMGSSPGPACYGLGGNEATLTDALLTLGYLDPDRFLAGSRRLDISQARSAIEQYVAGPLGIEIDEAALLIKDEAVTIMANLVAKTLKEADLDPNKTPLFAYGGNGPLVAVEVCERLGMPKAIIFALGPVFSAFGSSIADIVHVYERGLAQGLGDRAGARTFRKALSELCDQARRDLRGEGFDPDNAKFALDVEIGESGEYVLNENAKRFNDVAIKRAEARILKAYRGAARLGKRGHELVIVVRLRVSLAVGRYQPRRRADRVRRAAAPIGAREIAMPGGRITAAFFDWDQRRPGTVMVGPAVVHGDTMTCLVPEGWQLTTDGYGNGQLECQASEHLDAARNHDI